MTDKRAEVIAAALTRLGADRSDDEAWRTLIVTSRPKLLAHLARRLRGDLVLAEEALHDGYLALARVPHLELMPSHSFEAYVLRVAVNAAITRSRSQIRRQQRELSAAQSWDEEKAARPEASLERTQRWAEIEALLETHERRLLQYLLEGRPIEEIAHLEGLSYSSCAVRIHRLRKKLEISVRGRTIR